MIAWCFHTLLDVVRPTRCVKMSKRRTLRSLHRAALCRLRWLRCRLAAWRRLILGSAFGLNVLGDKTALARRPPLDQRLRTINERLTGKDLPSPPSTKSTRPVIWWMLPACTVPPIRTRSVCAEPLSVPAPPPCDIRPALAVGQPRQKTHREDNNPRGDAEILPASSHHATPLQFQSES
jgi:hypothetical protein